MYRQMPKARDEFPLRGSFSTPSGHAACGLFSSEPVSDQAAGRVIMRKSLEEAGVQQKFECNVTDIKRQRDFTFLISSSCGPRVADVVIDARGAYVVSQNLTYFYRCMWEVIVPRSQQSKMTLLGSDGGMALYPPVAKNGTHVAWNFWPDTDGSYVWRQSSGRVQIEHKSHLQ